MRRSKSSPFVLDAVEEFLRTKAAKEPKTLASYSGALLGSERGTKRPLGLPLAPYFRNRRLDSLAPDELTAWFAQRVSGAAQDTKHRISKQSRAFLRFAYTRGYTGSDFSSALDAFAPGEARHDWLTWEDVHRLLGKTPEFRLRFASAWLFFTGCRVGEAISASQADVRRIKDRQGFLWSIPETTKTHRARLVWLPEALSTYIEESRMANSPRPDWPLLWDCEGRGFGRVESPAARITAATISASLGRAAYEAGLDFRVTPHVARHTYCTNWITELGDGEHAMEKLSRQVGASVATLRSTYVHVQYSEQDWEHIRTFGGHPS